MASFLVLLLLVTCLFMHSAYGSNHEEICDICNCYHQKTKLIVNCAYLDLDEIPPGIPIETYKLFLQGNQLPDLGATTSLGANQLPNLKVLYLMNNPIASVTTAFFAVVPRLHTLMLHHCEISSLPANVFSSLTRLKWLWINHNELTAVPPALLHGLVQLREFYMYNNSVVTMPDGVFRDTAVIKHMYMFENNIPVSELSCCQMCGLPEPVDVKWGLVKQDTKLACGYTVDVTCTIAGSPVVCYKTPATGGKGKTYIFSSADKTWRVAKGLLLACLTLALVAQQLLL